MLVLRFSSAVARRIPVNLRLAALQVLRRIWPAGRSPVHPDPEHYSIPSWTKPLLVFVGDGETLAAHADLATWGQEQGWPVAFIARDGQDWRWGLLGTAASPQQWLATRQNGSLRWPVEDLPRQAASPLGVLVPTAPNYRPQAEAWSPRLGFPVLPPSTSFHHAEKFYAAVTRLFPPVSLLVVAYNEAEATEACLQSLYAHTGYPRWEVIVVDNASTDETPQVLDRWAREESNLKVVRNQVNRGFPAACNQAAGEAQGEIFCLLNNDTVVTPGWLASLVDELLRRPKVGLVGPTSQGVANEARVNAPYRSLEELPLWALARRQRYFRRSRSMGMLALFCAATWRRIWEELGGLDEDFGLGLFEDDDFSFRLRERGYDLRCRLDAFVHHFQSSSFSRLSDTGYWQLYERNRKLFWQKRKARRQQR
ncbi:MAG: glycosyltransferase family 2 protein [Thermoanaerobaculum sp.]|nr:glycosyltransferase family 2 protein [Thermoanaerobaculum sp.]